MKFKFKKTTIKEIQEHIEEIKKVPEYNLVTYDYASLYPTMQKPFSDEFIRKLKIQQRNDKLNRILGEE